MIAGLKPYPAMKDSGVPWLGQVPEHWEVSTLRRKLRPYDGIKIGPFGSQLKLDQMSSSGYKVYGQANVIARDFASGTKFVDQQKFDELSACEVRPGDLVVTMMGTSGRCARVPDTAATGIMDSHLLRLRTDGSIVADFAALVIDEAPYLKKQISVAGKGSIMQGLNSGMVKNLVLVLPPPPEQAAIGRFLGHMDRRIRRYIRAKQKLIKLLEELKQAIIHRAVTRGLDPNVRLKPSGVEWLGEIPDNFKRAKLGRLCVSIRDGTHNPPPAAQGVHRLLSVRNIIDGRFVTRADDRTMTPTSFIELQRSYTVRAGDVVLALVGATTGKSAVVESMENVTVQRSIGILRPNEALMDSHYLNLIVSSKLVQLQIQEIMDKYAAQPGIYLADVSALQIVFPELNTQRRIAAAVRGEAAGLDASMEVCRREINFLVEYRTRLIADMVTGKLDVRELAERLPDEAKEPEPLDEADVLDGAEEYADDDLGAAPEEAEA